MSTCGGCTARWLLLGALMPAALSAQESCRCDFGDKSYSAVGTKAACNAFVFDTRRCEVSFSAIGGNPQTLDNLKAPISEEQAYALTIRHVTALRDHDYKTLSSPEFLTEALPLLMRATYARESVEKNYPLVELDRVAMAFLKEQTPRIARVFARAEKPGRGELPNGYGYAIDVGSVVLTTPKGARLSVVVFTPEKR